MKITIDVPAGYFENMSQADFIINLELFLHENRPCEICHGHGIVNTGTGAHAGPDHEDKPCEICNYEEWSLPW